jgi:hypothetical protein
MSLSDPQTARNAARPISTYMLPLEFDQTRLPHTDLFKLTAAFPTLESLMEIQNQTDPQCQLQWCKNVFWLVEKTRKVESSTPPSGPVYLSDHQLQALAEQASTLILRMAPSLLVQNPSLFLAEAIYHKGKLLSSGAFPNQCPQNPREAFRYFEASARAGYAPAWFQLGRDYETFNDFHHAWACFDRGVRAGEVGCFYVSISFKQ